MGFGHHRLAYGTSSWALDTVTDRDVYFHDIVNLDSGEADLIDEAETLYSAASRFATEGPDIVDKIWSGATSGGGGSNDNALRLQCRAAELITAVLSGLDKKSPVIATHPIVGATAVAAGFENVVNLVVDNHAQWFVVVPGALNLVQGSSLYLDLLSMGVPESEIELAGHWCHKDLVDGIPASTQRRIRRLTESKPLRLLIPVGGAGAQEDFLTSLIEASAYMVKAGLLQLFLNAGDHPHIREGFEVALNESRLDYDLVSDVDGLNGFQEHLSAERNEPRKAVTLFAYNETYPAVMTTDKLINVADVLVCKPSEMAFYPIPKLHIHRVGGHERKSAIRAAEIGDGTMEARTVEDTISTIDMMLSKKSILTNMNRAIEKNKDSGLYDGCKIAVERALERAESMES